MNSCRVLVKHSEQALGCFLAADRSMMGGEALPIDVVLPRSISRRLSNHLSIYNTAVGNRVGLVGICRNLPNPTAVVCRNLSDGRY